MRFPLAVVACMFFSLISVAQEKAQPASSSNSDQTTCESHSRELWADYKARDQAALTATLAEGFRAIEEGADFFDAKAYISGLDGFELKSYTLSDYTVISLAHDACLVNYHARYEGVSAGEKSQATAGFSEVWVRRGGVWKIQYLQETYVK